MANNQTLEELFASLQVATIEEVIKVIKSGEATSGDVRNAISLLKDNGFTMRDVPNGTDPNKFLEDLSASMPQLPNISANGEIIEVEAE